MIDKVIGTLKEYLAAHDRDIIVLSDEQKAEIKAEITFMECMRESSYIEEVKNLKTRIDSLQNAIIDLVSPVPPAEKRVTRKDFLEIYNKCLSGMFEDQENGIWESEHKKKIYGKDITVHWNGIYCDCYDGATPCNHIIPGIKSLDEELSGEEVPFD